MPRSIWNGTVGFGLVYVPVKVFSATESKTVRFREVHVSDGAKIEHRRICPKDGEEAYALLQAALERADRAAVGRWVFHNRERTVIVRPLDGVLALHTMRFADEIADPSDFELGRVQRKPSAKEIKMASSLVDGLHTRFKPSDYKDSYRRAVLKVIERKAAGKEIEPPEDAPPEE